MINGRATSTFLYGEVEPYILVRDFGNYDSCRVAVRIDIPFFSFLFLAGENICYDSHVNGIHV